MAELDGLFAGGEGFHLRRLKLICVLTVAFVERAIRSVRSDVIDLSLGAMDDAAARARWLTPHRQCDE
jgi:hypothetical protein